MTVMTVLLPPPLSLRLSPPEPYVVCVVVHDPSVGPNIIEFSKINALAADQCTNVRESRTHCVVPLAARHTQTHRNEKKNTHTLSHHTWTTIRWARETVPFGPEGLAVVCG